MGCYIIPTVVAFGHYILRKQKPRWRESANHLWLNLLMAGGAIFGIIDHWWNGELYLLRQNPASDLMLGVLITTVIFLAWAAIIVLNKTKLHKPSEVAN